MTHREFKLTVRKEIVEHSGREVTPVHYRVGDTMVVGEAMFAMIRSGITGEIMTQEGFIRFDKYDFENEVACTEVTVEYTIRKLGQRKNKVD